MKSRIIDAHSGTDHQLGERSYILCLMMWVMLGFASTGFGASLTWGTPFSKWATLGLALITFLGCFLAAIEALPIAIFGYLLITFPFGAMLGPVVATYTKASLINVLGTTAILSLGMGGIGFIYPKSLGGLHTYLFGALWMLILSQFGTIILAAMGFPVQAAWTWMDWFGVALFSGLLIYDVNQAVRSERTLLSSLGFAVAIYLDILNIFIRLLELTGKKDK